MCSLWRKISIHAQYILKTSCNSYAQSSRAVVSTGWNNCHKPNETMDVLQGMLGNNIISRRAALTWLPKLPDLSAPNYHLWGYLKERDYINRPENLEDFKDNIRQEIRDICLATLECSCKSSFLYCC